jgi:hypothetical protein
LEKSPLPSKSTHRRSSIPNPSHRRPWPRCAIPQALGAPPRRAIADCTARRIWTALHRIRRAASSRGSGVRPRRRAPHGGLCGGVYPDLEGKGEASPPPYPQQSRPPHGALRWRRWRGRGVGSERVAVVRRAGGPSQRGTGMSAVGFGRGGRRGEG